MGTLHSADEHDLLLQASRRVDWRFLLPSPELRRVGCIGVEAELVAACARFGDSSVELRDPREGEAGSFDVVVLSAPSPRVLSEAVSLLGPDGWLYVELYAPFSRRGRRRRPRLSRDYRALLEGLGLLEVQAHWHWPSFSSCTEIIPLDDSGVIRNALSRRARGATPKAVAARVVVATRLLELAAPCTSVIGRAPRAEAAS